MHARVDKRLLASRVAARTGQELATARALTNAVTATARGPWLAAST